MRAAGSLCGAMLFGEAELDGEDEDQCRVPSMIMQFFQIASEAWLLCIAFDLCVAMSNPFSTLENR